MINMWQIDVNATLNLIYSVVSIALPCSALCACKACAPQIDMVLPGPIKHQVFPAGKFHDIKLD